MILVPSEIIYHSYTQYGIILTKEMAGGMH